MPTAFYVVDPHDYDEAAGPTGYECARVIYGPFANREDAERVWKDDHYTDGCIVELDRGDETPTPLDGTPAEQAERAAALARETLARRVEQLANLWAGVSPDVREAVDAECGGLVAALDALVDAASEIEEAAA